MISRAKINDDSNVKRYISIFFYTHAMFEDKI